MKLVSISMIRNEEYWIWYTLTSVFREVEEMLVFDNHSEDDTLDIVRGMDHIADKLYLWEEFGGENEHETRERTLEIARQRGATHALLLDGDEVHDYNCLGFAKQLIELHQHEPALNDPPNNPGKAGDCTPTDGILIKNIGFRPVHPGFRGPDTCRPEDRALPDTDHGCYNFAIRIVTLANLQGNGQGWTQHGFVEQDGVYIQSSAHTLWLPRLWYHHYAWHPRSRARIGDAGYGRPVYDHGSVELAAWVGMPQVLLDPRGPSNPTLDYWEIPKTWIGPHKRELTPRANRTKIPL